jgi:pilus assembly protein Flp/PilA
MPQLLAFFRNQRGATAIEYGLLAAGVSLAIVSVVWILGGTVTDTYTSVSSALH